MYRCNFTDVDCQILNQEYVNHLLLFVKKKVLKNEIIQFVFNK